MSYSIDQFAQELKRGTLTLAVLKMLDERHYGYSLKKSLLDQHFEIEESTLYPMLRRLEKQGFISSVWEIEENRPRKYYQINDEGRNLLSGLIKEYNHLADAVNKILIQFHEYSEICDAGDCPGEGFAQVFFHQPHFLNVHEFAFGFHRKALALGDVFAEGF